MKTSRVVTFAALFVTAYLAATSAQTRRPPRRPIPNLNGPWESDEEGIVTVFQSGATIQVLTSRLCGSTSRPFYMVGTLSAPNEAGVMTISNGQMIRCENQHPIIQTCCGPRDTWQTTFEATVVGDYSISGTRVAEIWNAKTDSNGSVDKSTCNKEKEFDDSIILLRQSPTATPPGTTPPASPSASPSPSPTPANQWIDDALDTIQENWNDFVETVEDKVDDISDDTGFSESWDNFKNDPGVKHFLDHTADHEHTYDGPEDDS
jgi:hypothetical protein